MAKKAVHFGGGNIGRGFVAEFLHESGYEVVFVDVMDSIIEALQNTKSYKVTEVDADGGKHVKTITNYRAINSKYNLEDVIKEISEAVVVTCAVGPNILKFIASPIAQAIDRRTEKTPLAVIACENAIGATDNLRGFILDEKNTKPERLATIDDRARFANSAIDRIVPTQDPGAGLDVKIESFFEWCVDKTPFESAGGHPDIKGVHWVEDLHPFIERKLFTVNTGHATAAYYGHNAGKRTIHDALEDKRIHDIVRDTLKETSHLVSTKHDITPEEQAEYVETIVARISNPMLEDVVDRVGRAPLRKLSRKERFIGPASQLAERGDKVDNLLGGIEMCLRFQNIEGDDESAELAKILANESATDAALKITGLEKEHPLFDRVVKVIEKVQAEKK